jgi:hypothetical protein
VDQEIKQREYAGEDGQAVCPGHGGRFVAAGSDCWRSRDEVAGWGRRREVL